MVDPKQLITVAIDQNTVAAHTIWTPPSGTRWVLWYLRLTAGAALECYIKSGTTAISGALTYTFSAAGTIVESNGGEPIAVGRAAGDAFVIDLADAQNLDGFATLGAVQGAGPTA